MMEKFTKIVFVSSFVLAAFAVTLVLGQGGGNNYVCDPVNPDVANACLGCMCQTSSKCNATIGCINQGTLCGPFLISRAFWIDAGRCTLPGFTPNDNDGR